MFLQFRQLAKCVQRVRHSDPRDTAGGDRTGVARTITALHWWANTNLARSVWPTHWTRVPLTVCNVKPLLLQTMCVNYFLD